MANAFVQKDGEANIAKFHNVFMDAWAAQLVVNFVSNLTVCAQLVGKVHDVGTNMPPKRRRQIIFIILLLRK